MPRRWKIFRALCTVQIVVTGLHAGISFVSLLYNVYLFKVLDAVCFTSVFLFALLGYTMINRNYPDEPPQGAQKTYFNWLYIVNFLALAYLLAYVARAAYTIVSIMFYNLRTQDVIIAAVMLLLYLSMLFLHVYILYSMFRLRRELYANYLKMVDSLGEQVP